MATPTIHKNTINGKFQVTLLYKNNEIVDLTNISVITFKFLPPLRGRVADDVRKERTGEVYGDPEDGVVQYLTVEDDLDEKGTWKLQVELDFTDGSQFFTDTGKFKVKDNL